MVVSKSYFFFLFCFLFPSRQLTIFWLERGVRSWYLCWYYLPCMVGKRLRNTFLVISTRLSGFRGFSVSSIQDIEFLGLVRPTEDQAGASSSESWKVKMLNGIQVHISLGKHIFSKAWPAPHKTCGGGIVWEVL